VFEGVRHSEFRSRVEGNQRGASDISCITLRIRATEIGL
jgi:hypothetical protein